MLSGLKMKWDYQKMCTVLGKSANLPIAFGLSCSSVLCVFVCVCLMVTIVRTGQILAKIKNVKMTFRYFDTCNLRATMPVLYSVTLTYFFKVKYFKC